MYSLQSTRPGTYQPMIVTRHNKAKQSMPLCRYDQWCERPGCIYRHSSVDRQHSKDRVCLNFLQGRCVFKDECWYTHGDEEETAGIKAKLKAQPCQYGGRCPFGDLCLFGHLRDVAWVDAYSNPQEVHPPAIHPTPNRHVIGRHKIEQVTHQSTHQSQMPKSHSSSLHTRVRSW